MILAEDPSGPFLIDGLLYNDNANVANFVASRISHMSDQKFGPNVAIGVIKNDNLVGGVVYHNLRVCDGKPIDIELSGSFDETSWVTPKIVPRLFEYPFVTVGCVRLTSLTARKNRKARVALEAMGFELEGVHDLAIAGKEAAMSYGMLQRDCLWLHPARRREAIERVRAIRAKWNKSEVR